MAPNISYIISNEHEKVETMTESCQEKILEQK